MPRNSASLLILLLSVSTGASGAPTTATISETNSCSPRTCATPDLVYLQDYANSLNATADPLSLSNLTESIETLPFGALRSDWTRMFLLQERQPVGTALRDNIVRLSRLLIFAYFEVEDYRTAMSGPNDELTTITPRTDVSVTMPESQAQQANGPTTSRKKNVPRTNTNASVGVVATIFDAGNETDRNTTTMTSFNDLLQLDDDKKNRNVFANETNGSDSFYDNDGVLSGNRKNDDDKDDVSDELTSGENFSTKRRAKDASPMVFRSVNVKSDEIFFTGQNDEEKKEESENCVVAHANNNSSDTNDGTAERGEFEVNATKIIGDVYSVEEEDGEDNATARYVSSTGLVDCRTDATELESSIDSRNNNTEEGAMIEAKSIEALLDELVTDVVNGTQRDYVQLETTTTSSELAETGECRSGSCSNSNDPVDSSTEHQDEKNSNNTSTTTLAQLMIVRSYGRDRLPLSTDKSSDGGSAASASFVANFTVTTDDDRNSITSSTDGKDSAPRLEIERRNNRTETSRSDDFFSEDARDKRRRSDCKTLTTTTSIDSGSLQGATRSVPRNRTLSRLQKLTALLTRSNATDVPREELDSNAFRKAEVLRSRERNGEPSDQRMRNSGRWYERKIRGRRRRRAEANYKGID